MHYTFLYLLLNAQKIVEVTSSMFSAKITMLCYRFTNLWS